MVPPPISFFSSFLNSTYNLSRIQRTLELRNFQPTFPLHLIEEALKDLEQRTLEAQDQERGVAYNTQALTIQTPVIVGAVVLTYLATAFLLDRVKKIYRTYHGKKNDRGVKTGSSVEGAPETPMAIPTNVTVVMESVQRADSTSCFPEPQGDNGMIPFGPKRYANRGPLRGPAVSSQRVVPATLQNGSHTRPEAAIYNLNTNRYYPAQPC